MTETSILHIPEKEKPLNKRQKEFNLLSEKIEMLDGQLAELREAYDEMLRRIPSEQDPLVREYQGYRVDIVNLWDRNYTAEHFRNIYQTKLTYLITENAFDLIKNHGHDELKALFDRYSPISIETLLEEDRLREATRITDPAFLLDEQADAPESPEISFHELSREEQQRIKAQKRENKAEQRLRESKQAKTTRSVRSVYMELVKSFHPDLETDEAERKRKTGIMQEITEAYQEGRLLSLLKLQMEIEQIDRDKLESLDKNQLNYFNRILSQQAAELEQQKIALQMQISAICGLPYQHANSLVTVISKFNTNLNELRTEIKNIKALVKHWQTPSQLKAYLKTYEIPGLHSYEHD
jgi:hypothetical protein